MPTSRFHVRMTRVANMSQGRAGPFDPWLFKTENKPKQIKANPSLPCLPTSCRGWCHATTLAEFRRIQRWPAPACNRVLRGSKSVTRVPCHSLPPQHREVAGNVT